MQIQEITKKWGKHIVAILLFAALSAIYFAPAVFDGKVIRQGDMDRYVGMVGGNQMDQYAKTAQPGEFSAWSDAMFGGMPYTSGYGDPAPSLPSFKIIETPFVSWGAFHAGIVLVALICFYILMCSIGVSNRWLAIGGAIAYAFASYNFIIIEAGHITKAYAIAYMPLTLAGMALLFKQKYYWGGILFLLGIAFSIAASHIQITYYLMLLCWFIYAGYLIINLKKKKYTEVGKTTAIMLVSVLLAVMPNVKNMYTNWELGKHSIRGASELTPQPDESGKAEKASSGLDKDYAFAWSYGKGELLTLLVPNAYGGGSNGSVGPNSALHKAFAAHGQQAGETIPTITYWGDKSFTSGPVYFGAVVCFLFVLGMFVIRHPMKWWLFAGCVFLTLLALGRNFEAFNDIMFHYLPLYNKFRTVEMALVIPGLVVPLIGFWGLALILSGKVERPELKRGLIASLAITGGLALILWLMPSLFLDFRSPMDSYYQLPEWYYNALLQDRKALATADAMRSLLFIVVGAALLFWYYNSQKKERIQQYVGIGFAVLILIDLWSIDRRYLNDSNYAMPNHTKEIYKPTVADSEILKDSRSFRVLNLNDPFQNATTSYYHHSIGGYHAAKLRRYQELIDYRLQKELQSIIGQFKNAKSTADIIPALSECQSLNMLNTRYIIYNPEQMPLVNPFAYGNAWFVENIELVENADAEIAALDRIDPKKTAVVDKRFEKEVEGFTPATDSSAVITLESYRPNRLTYTSKSANDQIAIFSEIYYQPGWTATIDGKETPHFRADWILRGLKIPAGEHLIVFEFRPKGYIIAANVEAYSSFFILLLLIGAVGYSLWKKIKNNQAEK